MISKFTIKGIRRFNEKKVIEKTKMLLGDTSQFFFKWEKSLLNDERDSYVLLLDSLSTQGVNVKHLIGGSIIVELPWLASGNDVQLCFAFLNAVKVVHRGARILDEKEKNADLTDIALMEQGFLRHQNMSEILNKGERIVLTGINRDFHLNPIKYMSEESSTKKIHQAFLDFIVLQWSRLDLKNLIEEKRHVTDDEEFSTIRVVDNTANVFIGVCRYVGMMRGNTCKMVEFEDFCRLMDDQKEFQRWDAAQAILDKMPCERWNELFEKAEGIVRENFRKTFIMRWNTDISNYKLCEFEEAMENFWDDGFYYDWSIWDYQKAHVGDKFFMIRTGNGKHGVVMRGTIIGTPYPDEDWSGKGRKVYYIRMRLSHIIHPDKSPLLLTTEELSKAIPEFNWEEGHSGVILDDTTARRLDKEWNSYEEKVHQIAEEEYAELGFNYFYKEKVL